VVLWTGNLYPNKDPLTILAGFECLLERAPGARLYMAYRYESLLAQVQARIAASASLDRAVTLLGEIPHDQIEACYNSADLFVQGSAREGSGAALLDALACGVVPVVTDIPSFRVLTNGGRIGALWPVGDREAFTTALLRIAAQPLAPLSLETRRFFDTTLSFPALGRRAVAVYRQLTRARAARQGRR
jgi:glycosyltransferase involved in cell wall biosynthesis